MKAVLNRLLFEAAGVDSGSLNMLGSVVHNFPEEGQYSGSVLKGSEVVGQFHVTVAASCADMQADIDLRSLDRSAGDRHEGELEDSFLLNPKGYAIFYVSRGRGGYAAQVRKSGAEHRDKPFDSRELQRGDLFAASFVRPASYSVANLVTKARAELSVSRPRPAETPYRPPEPLFVECTERGFVPDRISLEFAQGHVYRITVPSRIKIELTRPADERPSKPSPPERGKKNSSGEVGAKREDEDR